MRAHDFKENKGELIKIPLSDGGVITVHTYICSGCKSLYCTSESLYYTSDDKRFSWYGGKPPDEDCNIEIIKKVHEA